MHAIAEYICVVWNDQSTPAPPSSSASIIYVPDPLQPQNYIISTNSSLASAAATPAIADPAAQSSWQHQSIPVVNDLGRLDHLEQHHVEPPMRPVHAPGMQLQDSEVGPQPQSATPVANAAHEFVSFPANGTPGLTDIHAATTAAVPTTEAIARFNLPQAEAHSTAEDFAQYLAVVHMVGFPPNAE